MGVSVDTACLSENVDIRHYQRALLYDSSE